VATPNAASSKDGLLALARNPLSSRGSYAAALKAKPTDWHLEFSMDDHILPLDLTIYGAIHQHEMRKKTGATPLNMIWQGVYTIKFKKVVGPAPSSESKTFSLIFSPILSVHQAERTARILQRRIDRPAQVSHPFLRMPLTPRFSASFASYSISTRSNLRELHCQWRSETCMNQHSSTTN